MGRGAGAEISATVKVVVTMDLIDRAALREAMYHEAFETDSKDQRWDSGCWIRYKMFEKNLNSAPTIEAVPLEPLCEFLEKCGADSYCGTCKQIMGECFTDGRGCGSEHFWKELLTKWMEEQYDNG